MASSTETDDNSRISCNPTENRFKLFKEFEQGTNTVLPVYIKNMLLYSGYDTKFALQRLTNDDFETLEQFVKSSFSSIVADQPNLENYYGLFKDKPDQFTILPGHKKMILEIVNFFKKPPLKSKSLLLKKTDLPTKSSQGAEKRKFSSKLGPTISDEISEDSTSDNVIVETGTGKQQNLNVDPNSEEKKIKKNISNCLNKTSNTLCPPQEDDNSRISCNLPENRFKLFKEFEQRTNTVLPVCIKNMLLYSGYDIKFALQLLEMDLKNLKKPPLKSESLSLKKTDLPTKSSQGDEISEDSTSDNVIVETDTEKQQNLNVDPNSEEKTIKKKISNRLTITSKTLCPPQGGKDDPEDDPAVDPDLKISMPAKKNALIVGLQWGLSTIANMFCVIYQTVISVIKTCAEYIKWLVPSMDSNPVPSNALSI